MALYIQSLPNERVRNYIFELGRVLAYVEDTTSLMEKIRA